MRFEFGKNWERFLRDVNDDRVQRAQSSLKERLRCHDLVGKSFLDMGSGSDLFSLAARRLDATVVRSIVIPTVACTRKLKQLFLPTGEPWRIEPGSALDKNYLRTLAALMLSTVGACSIIPEPCGRGLKIWSRV